MFFFGICIAGQIINIQFFQKDSILKNVSSTTAGYRTVSANRGDIYSQKGSLLATSLNYYEVGMDLSSDALTDENFNLYLDALCDSLTMLFPQKSAKRYREELIKARKNRDRWYKLNSKVSYPDFLRLKKFPLFELGRYKSGLAYRKYVKREKPFGVLASRTIGSRVPYGLEGAFDNYLKGRDGEQYQRKITSGVWVTVNDQNSINPIDGYNVHSTIDIGIQEIVEDELKNSLFHHKASYGCAVLMEVSTGKVRAIANLKMDSLGNYQEDRNYAVGDVMEPGSTFKLASMMALLEDGFVSLEDKVEVGRGVMKFYDRRMKDSHLYSENRTMTVKEVFEESSNVGIAKLVTKYYEKEPQKFVDRLYGFGLQNELGLDILGEQSPRIKDPSKKDQWFGTTLPWSSIGYEVALTPMQMLAFYNAVANNGEMVRPYFVEKVTSNERTIAEFSPFVLHHAICSQGTVEKLQLMLKGVVSHGTAKWPFYKTPYDVAGKTGTAQINYGNRKKGDTQAYRASFVGYFPADEPVYSCIIVITNPTANGFYGSQVAAPVFRKISDRLFTTCQSLQIDIDSVVHQKELEYLVQNIEGRRLNTLLTGFNINGDKASDENSWVVSTIEGNKVKQNSATELKVNVMPNVLNMPLGDAIYLLENMGLKVLIDGSGQIKKQSLSPGSRVSKGQIIELKLN